MTPDYFYHYSKHSEYQGRVDQIIQWLSLPKAQRPRFVASYFSLVDSMGHEFGPDAPQTRDAVKQLDTLMGQLQARLSKLEQDVNLVIVSDHGMAVVDPDKSILLNTLPSDDGFIVKKYGAAFTNICKTRNQRSRHSQLQSAFTRGGKWPLYSVN